MVHAARTTCPYNSTACINWWQAHVTPSSLSVNNALRWVDSREARRATGARGVDPGVLTLAQLGYY
jgi:hypothetical protein